MRRTVDAVSAAGDHRDLLLGPPGRQVGSILPTIAVFGLLGALLWYGVQTGWTLPKLSTLLGSADKKNNDWCETHSVPESICIECKPDLMSKRSFGWCAEHGVHDCPLHHPEVAELASLPTVTQ